MLEQPGIFTVHVFHIDGAGRRQLHVHHVAACASSQAERRIRDAYPDHLHGQCFITTDEHEEIYQGGRGCRLYTSSFREQLAHITDEQLQRWMRSHTRACVEDGEHRPAAFRRFHVPFARVGRGGGHQDGAR